MTHYNVGDLVMWRSVNNLGIIIEIINDEIDEAVIFWIDEKYCNLYSFNFLLYHPYIKKIS